MIRKVYMREKATQIKSGIMISTDVIAKIQ